MTATDADTLYGLLPAVVRLRDETSGGGVLRALITVIAEQAQAVEAGLEQQYDDQFVETCAPWVLPYIGDLVGFTPLLPLGPNQPAATRGEVASTIGDRRRKGTLAMLEQLCSDVTRETVTDKNGVSHALAGWTGVAVEYFARIATTQYVRNHLRPGNALVDVRSLMTAVDIGGAFDVAPRSVDVRRIASHRGRYNLPNIGLFVWRLTAYDNIGHPARAVGPNRYTVDPFGRDVPMVNRPAPVVSTFALTGRRNLPFPLQRYPLFARITPYAAEPPDRPPVRVNVAGVAVAPETISWCDLTTWSPPTTPGIEVAVDPVLGRLVFAAPPDADAEVLVDFAYAFSGDYGGGTYDQPIAAAQGLLEQALGAITVTTFAGAALETATHEVVEISDSGIRVGDLTLSPGAGLLVVRAGSRQRPLLAGNLVITGVAGASVTLRGLGIDGTLTVAGAGPLTVRLEHCTVRGAVDWSDTDVTGTLVLDHTLSGPVLANPGVDVEIADSAIDAGADASAAVAGTSAGAPAGSVRATRSTVLGTIAARTIPLLDNSIVTGPVTSAEQQAGCVRYSYLPITGSCTPRRFRCQPDGAVDAALSAALAANQALTPAQRATIQAAIERELRPVFVSRAAGRPGYLQLADATPDPIRSTGEHGNEMGLFAGLYSARRERNLAFRINEYLRIGLEAAIFHAT